MPLKAIHETLDEIPAEFQSLYTERDGKFELTGIEGVKTALDVSRVTTALTNEREAHKLTKGSLRNISTVVGEIEPTALQAIIDEHTDFKARLEAGGDNNEDAIKAAVEARMPAALRPLERERDGFRSEAEALRSQNSVLLGAHRQRLIHDAVDTATSGEKGIKVISDAKADIRMLAEHVLDVDFEGDNRVFVKESAMGFTPGLAAKDWLADIQQSGNRRHWFEGNISAGARTPNSVNGGSNPFAKDSFNLTEGAKLFESDPVRAVALATAAKRTDLIPAELRGK